MIKIGTASVDITPPVGTSIGGNYRDDYKSRGIFQNLYAHALVIDDGSKEISLVVSDLLGIPAQMVKKIRKKVYTSCGLKEEQVMVAATHTHSGPDTVGLAPESKVDEKTLEMIIKKIAQAVEEAYANKVKAKIGFGSTKEEGIPHNRRLRTKDGKVHMNWEKIPPGEIAEVLGPIDPELGVGKIEDNQGRLKGIFLNYTCHPAILAGDNLLISADYPGFIYKKLKESLGEDILTLFTNGTEGNINHINPFDPSQERGFKEAERIGNILAQKVTPFLQELSVMDDCKVDFSVKKLEIPRRKIPEDRLNWAKEVLAKWDGKFRNLVDGLPDEFYAQETMILKELEDEPVRTEVQIFRIGKTAFAGLPGEVFVEYGLKIKGGSPFPKTFVIGLANDWIGYVPTRRAFEEGGYEPTPARSSQLDEGAGEMIVEETLNLLNELWERK